MSTILVRDGLVFDGSGAPARHADVLVREGRIAAVAPALDAEADEVVDAAGCWVTPGFVDLHTHYDAELELLPGLSESVRHGITTVLVGSCGLSMAVGRPVDLADMFCRVEGIPRAVVLPLLERTKDWEDPADYLRHLEGLPLGPNVTALLGHSTIRAHVMGLGRSLDPAIRPERSELASMARLLEDALDAGYLGLSINTLPWDKMDGEAFRGRPTPSVHAGFAEYRHLTRILRRRDRLFQAVPDVSTKVNAVFFYWETLGLWRRPLKTMLITLLDTKAERLTFRLVGGAARLVNALGGSIRLQSLPNPFDIWSDGLEVPVLEEIGAGTEALGLGDLAERSRLLRDPAFRERFRREWRSPFGRAYHRDLYEARIVGCPDATVVGRSFGEVADERGVDPVDLFLDLQADHGNDLRWHSVIGNDRPEWLEWIVTHPAVLVGFSDAGAHLRNMAFYNFPLRLLKRVRDAAEAGRPFLSVEAAVHRLTGEIGDYLGIDAGHLEPGRRADLVVIDPAALDDDVERIEEAEMPGFSDADGRPFRRLVRRNDRAIRRVLVGGHTAWRDGSPGDGLGERPMGTLLRARG